jgi:hypothetical protein
LCSSILLPAAAKHRVAADELFLVDFMTRRHMQRDGFGHAIAGLFGATAD